MHPLHASWKRAGFVSGLAAALVLVIALPSEGVQQTSAAEVERQRRLEEARELEMQRRLAETRTEFLSTVGGIPVGRSDRARRQDFRADLRLFRRLVVEFWTLKFAPMSEEWARADLGRRAEELAGILRRMREHVNRGADLGPFEPVPLAGRTFPEQMDQFFLVGSRLPVRAAAVTEDEVLDFGLLLEVRQDFRTLESWTAALPESVR